MTLAEQAAREALAATTEASVPWSVLRDSLRDVLDLLDAERAATAERLAEVTRLLRDAGNYIGCGAEEACYGGFHGGDPRDFHPDPECSTEEERANHAAACAAFAEAEARGEKPVLSGTHELVRDENGQILLHSARNPYGLGTMIYCDEDGMKLVERISEWLSTLPGMPPGKGPA